MYHQTTCPHCGNQTEYLYRVLSVASEDEGCEPGKFVEVYCSECGKTIQMFLKDPT